MGISICDCVAIESKALDILQLFHVHLKKLSYLCECEGGKKKKETTSPFQ